MKTTKETTTVIKETRECLFCAETIKTNAKKCRYCGEFLDGYTREKVLAELKGRGPMKALQVASRILGRDVVGAPNAREVHEVTAFPRSTVTFDREMRDVQYAIVKNWDSSTGLELTGFDLAGRDLSWLDLSGANLSSTNFERADLYGTKLARCSLFFINLERAKLRKANLQGSKLWRSYMQNADFSRADLSTARLNNTDLRMASFIDANLTKVLLRSARLEGVDFTRANLTGIQLKDSRYDRDTRWPEGFDPVAAGAVLIGEQMETTVASAGVQDDSLVSLPSTPIPLTISKGDQEILIEDFHRELRNMGGARIGTSVLGKAFDVVIDEEWITATTVSSGIPQRIRLSAAEYALGVLGQKRSLSKKEMEKLPGLSGNKATKLIAIIVHAKLPGVIFKSNSRELIYPGR